jgi:hypothetical protein
MFNDPFKGYRSLQGATFKQHRPVILRLFRSRAFLGDRKQPQIFPAELTNQTPVREQLTTGGGANRNFFPLELTLLQHATINTR